MTMTVEATFDGKVIQLDAPLELEPNTRVRVTISELRSEADEPYAFFHTALAMRVQGPTDWSERYEEYLYGELTGGYE